MNDADEDSPADARRLRLLKRLLRERGYVRDRRDFWVAPDFVGLKPEMLHDSEIEDDEGRTVPARNAGHHAG